MTALIICWAVTSAAQQPPARQDGPPTPDLQQGKAAYEQSCARCHGLGGHGDGVDAKRFYPRPRDLTMGVYKFRSTASGTPPTDEDLFRTITQGLPGSNMPDWQHLDENVRWQLVYYLKSLSPTFEQTKPEPVTVAQDPGRQHADLAKGKALYQQLGCAACHGPQGRANGTSAAGLVDDWGMPIRPANLTQGWNYRGASDAHAVMLRVLTGIDGAGMPSYNGAVFPEDAWHLAYYVTSLQEVPHWNRVAPARYLEGGLPHAADDPRWDTAQQTDVRLRNAVTAEGMWATPPTVNDVTLQAIYNHDAVAFRLTWQDPSESRQPHPDAVAVVLKPAQAYGDVVTLQAWPSTGAPPLDLCSWSADVDTTQETVAENVERITAHQGRQVRRESAAGYTDGRWHLVLQRPRTPASPSGAAAIQSDVWTAMAFIVWDGEHPETRAISSWVDVDLRLKEAHAAKHSP